MFLKILRFVKSKLVRISLRFYIFIFARKSMQKLNSIILNLSLRARGYNNCCDGNFTGENFIVNKLKKFNLKIILDIGANIGSYSEYLLNNTDSKVVAFEPQIKCHESLDRLKIKFESRFQIVKKAVSDKSGYSDIYFGEEGSELASLSLEVNSVDYVGASNINSQKVELISIDEYLKNTSEKFENIDFIKIDVEGYEKEVLLGMSDLLKTNPPKFIQIEHNHHHLFRGHTMFQFGQILDKYICFQILPYNKGLIKRELTKNLSNIFMYSNFLFIRSDIFLD